MTEQIPIKAIKTGSTATALSEFSSGDTIPGQYLPPPPAGYIDGLIMQWVSGTALTVTSGSAYIPSLQRIVHVESPIAKTGLALAASAFSHVYLDGPTLDIVISATAPDTPYNGTARTMNGDSSKRYVGSVLTDSSGNIYNFSQSGNDVSYLSNFSSAPFQVVSNGESASRVNFSTSGIMPPTSTRALFRLRNTSTNGEQLIFDVPETGNAATSGILSVPAGTQVYAQLSAPSRVGIYIMNAAPSSGGANIYVIGYSFER